MPTKDRKYGDALLVHGKSETGATTENGSLPACEQTVTLDPSLLDLIEQAREQALISREQWILRAIVEKLSRDRSRSAQRMRWPLH